MGSILAFDDFVFQVLFADLAYILVTNDQQTYNPAVKIRLKFIYRGGTGENRGARFSIYLYDRDDTDLLGTASVPEPSTVLPDVYGINPKAPKEGRPPLTASQQDQIENNLIATGSSEIYTDGIFVRKVDNILETYWTGFFSINIPPVGSGPKDIKENTTFTGQAQIVS